MPLIEINALPQPTGVDLEAATKALNEAVAEAIGCRLDAVWTAWRTLEGPYGQGDQVRDVQPPDTHAPIVHVYLNRTPDETARMVAAIEETLPGLLGLAPGNVFVTVQPVAVAGALD